MPSLHTRNAINSLFHNTPNFSSFGPVGCICPVASSRLKGFIGGGISTTGAIIPISDNGHIAFFTGIIREGIHRVETANDVSRLTVRTVVSNSALEILEPELLKVGATVEAKIPLNDSHQIIYVGYNSLHRKLSEIRRDSYRSTIGTLLEEHAVQPGLMDLARRIAAHRDDYHVSILNGNGRDLSGHEIESTKLLLSTFGYDGTQAEQLIQNKQNLIGLLYETIGSEHSIVGISVIEARNIMLDTGEIIRIAEITDGTIANNHQGKSLYSRLLLDMFNHISETPDCFDLLIAESNMESLSLLRTATAQGRVFSGILPNHALIAGRMGTLEFKSLVVNYLTPELLRSFSEAINLALTIRA